MSNRMKLTVIFALAGGFLFPKGICAQVQESSSSARKGKQQYVASKVDKDGSRSSKLDFPSTTDAATPVQPTASYHVGIDDELMISVWHEPELSQIVVVRPDGMITLPLLNDIKVAGMTTEEMQSMLTEKMKPLVNEPQVTVIVKAVKSRKVFVVGSVAHQGVFPLIGRKSVLELIAEAGGLGPFAKAGSIRILRKENGKQVQLKFNYKKAITGKGSNPQLMPGDMVVVP